MRAIIGILIMIFAAIALVGGTNMLETMEPIVPPLFVIYGYVIGAITALAALAVVNY